MNKDIIRMLIKMVDAELSKHGESDYENDEQRELLNCRQWLMDELGEAIWD
jgi:hypothetical protein